MGASEQGHGDRKNTVPQWWPTLGMDLSSRDRPAGHVATTRHHGPQQASGADALRAEPAQQELDQSTAQPITVVPEGQEPQK